MSGLWTADEIDVDWFGCYIGWRCLTVKNDRSRGCIVLSATITVMLE